MKTRHSIVVRPQITIAEGMVIFLAKTTNYGRMGISCGEGAISQEEFCRRFCPIKSGVEIALRPIKSRWAISPGSAITGRASRLGPDERDVKFTVTSVRLQRLNAMTDEDKAAEDVRSNPLFARDDNPFLFVLTLTPC